VRRSGIIFWLAILNLALLAVIVWQGRELREEKSNQEGDGLSAQPGPESSSSSSFPEQLQAGPSADEPLLAGGHLAGETPAPEAPALLATNRPRFDWQQVESEDYRTYVKNLRAIGCPEQTIRDIVAADVLQAFAARRAEVMAERFRNFEYWKSDTNDKSARENLESRQREVDGAMSEALRELLEGEVVQPPTAMEWRQAALAQQLAFLPPDKQEQTRALLLQYLDVDAQIRGIVAHKTPENPEERLRVLEVYDRNRAELRAVLSPEEYERVDMTTSWTADNLRRAMTKFQPTEEEFRAIYREWRTQDENIAVAIAHGQPVPVKERVFAKIKELLPPGTLPAVPDELVEVIPENPHWRPPLRCGRA
jgi:hypothetical protein